MNIRFGSMQNELCQLINLLIPSYTLGRKTFLKLKCTYVKQPGRAQGGSNVIMYEKVLCKL